ncbi:ImmA/IrrE family metallo-endopeptidase [Levilactobacillus bambusae]|nr:ImmA/IrrE family metallo-endopeptidase [Levilactobacillus bambusae]
MTDLMNYAFDHQINVILTKDLPVTTVSITKVKLRTVIINTRYYIPEQIPLQFAHEIGHVIHNDDAARPLAFTSIYSDSKLEKSAHTWAIKKLLPYYLEDKEPEYINAYDFMESFAIPGHLYPVVVNAIHEAYCS